MSIAARSTSRRELLTLTEVLTSLQPVNSIDRTQHSTQQIVALDQPIAHLWAAIAARSADSVKAAPPEWRVPAEVPASVAVDSAAAEVAVDSVVAAAVVVAA